MKEDQVVNIVLNELKKRNLIHESKSSFKNTEVLLYNYNSLKKSIEENKKEINDLKQYGIPRKSSSITVMGNGGIKLDDASKIQNRIESLEESNYITDSLLKRLDRLLKECENPKYPNLIQLKYFDNKTLEEIVEYYSKIGIYCDVKTIWRNKNKIINELKILIFPNNSINELGY